MYCFVFDHMTSVFSHQKASHVGFSPCFRKAITTLAFSPDGKYVVTGEVGLWSWSPGTSVHVLSVIVHVQLNVFMSAP